MPEETMLNMRDSVDFTSRIVAPDVVSDGTAPTAITGLEDRAGANARRRGDLDTWTEGVEAATKSKDVRSNRTEQLRKDKKETGGQLEVKEFELDRLEDQESDLQQQEALATQKKTGVEAQVKAVDKQIDDLQYLIDYIGNSRKYEYDKATDASYQRIEDKKTFFRSDRDLELGSLEDKSGMGSSLEDLDKKIEKIQGLLGEDVKEAMAEIGRKGKKAKGLVESGTHDLTSERTKLSDKLKTLEARRSEAQKLYDARVEDVEDAEQKRRSKDSESIDKKYRKMEKKLIDRMGGLADKKKTLESKQQKFNEQLGDIANKKQELTERRNTVSSESTELRARLEALTNRLEAKKSQADRLLTALDSRMEKAVSEQGDISQELDLQVSVLLSAEAGLEETSVSLGQEVGEEFEEKYEILKHRHEEGTETARTERDSQIRETMETVGELQVSVDADNKIVVKPEFDLDTSDMDETMREAVVLASASESFTKLAAVAPQMREALGAYQTAVTEINVSYNDGKERINQQMDQLYEAIDTKVAEVKTGITEIRERAEQALEMVTQMEEAGENKDEGTWKRMTSAIGRWVSKLGLGKR